MRGNRARVVSGRWSVASNSSAAPPFFALTTDHWPLTTVRSGISLLEVLISMFILAVGLLSIASLLPVGGYQVQKANIENRKSTVGLNAFHEFRTRQMSNADRWIHYNSNPPGSAALVLTNGVLDSNLENYRPLSVAIDPLCLTNPNTAPPFGDVTSKFFPRLPQGVMNDDGSQPRMVRVSLANVPNYQVAEQIFVSRDDTVFEKHPTDPDGPAVSKWEFDAATNNALRRQFAGDFSWLVTLTPAHFNLQVPTPVTKYNLSIAIFYKRSLSSRFTTEGVEVERMVEVSPAPASLAGFGLGGGGLDLIGTAADTSVRPGQWVLVSGRYQVTTSASGPYPYFRWYRVTTVGEYEANSRAVTLAGPDWVDSPNATTGSWRCRPTHVAIFEGCVGVFEKTVHLEGPSVWSN